jgi:hypothetical protein
MNEGGRRPTVWGSGGRAPQRRQKLQKKHSLLGAQALHDKSLPRPEQPAPKVKMLVVGASGKLALVSEKYDLLDVPELTTCTVLFEGPQF